MNSISQLNHEGEFQRAWADPNNTRIELPPADGTESFVRSSQQGLWLEPAEYGLVLEQVCLNPTQQKVTFIGAAELPDRDKNLLRAGARQPLFHVERFTLIANDVWLPEFIEIYIRSDLNIKLTRRDIS